MNESPESEATDGPPDPILPSDYNTPSQERGLACSSSPGVLACPSATTTKSKHAKGGDGRGSAPDPAVTPEAAGGRSLQAHQVFGGAFCRQKPGLRAAARSRLDPGESSSPTGHPRSPGPSAPPPGPGEQPRLEQHPAPPTSNAPPREPSPALASFPRCDGLVHPGESDFRFSAEAESLVLPSRPAHP